MSFFSWLYSKGIAGAISSDLLRKYLGIKSQHPNEEEEKILVRVWNFWLTLNEEKIMAEDDEHTIVRLNIIKEKNEKYKNLFNLYQDILYIETEISTSDRKLWDNSMKVFIKESKKHGLDFSKEYDSYKRIISGDLY